MKTIAVMLLTLIVLTGCGENYKTSKDVSNFINRCPTKVTVNSHFTATLQEGDKRHISNTVRVTCEYED